MPSAHPVLKLLAPYLFLLQYGNDIHFITFVVSIVKIGTSVTTSQSDSRILDSNILQMKTSMKCSLVLFQRRYPWWTEKELGRAASSIPGPVSCHGYSPKESSQRTYGSWNETARKRHWNHWETQNYLHWRCILDEGSRALRNVVTFLVECYLNIVYL